MAKTLIRGGTVVTATEIMEADVLIDGKRVVGLLARGDAAPEVVVDQVIDASGKYVFPGGVDVHTHMELPFGGTNASDNFESGSRAAAWGGTTTIVDFAVQTIGESMMSGYEAWMEKAA
ncbi:MAG: amidohydrolase family protein, partial [Acidimicrobiia bacterium]|nr:amidohydrolase family protein [Acidimicrobiia bacterium]